MDLSPGPVVEVAQSPAHLMATGSPAGPALPQTCLDVRGGSPDQEGTALPWQCTL